jgi:hypothetical protein
MILNRLFNILWSIHLQLILTNEQFILSQEYTTALPGFSMKPCTLAGFDPGSFVSEADAPRRRAAPGRDSIVRFMLCQGCQIFLGTRYQNRK